MKSSPALSSHYICPSGFRSHLFRYPGLPFSGSPFLLYSWILSISEPDGWLNVRWKRKLHVPDTRSFPPPFTNAAMISAYFPSSSAWSGKIRSLESSREFSLLTKSKGRCSSESTRYTPSSLIPPKDGSSVPALVGINTAISLTFLVSYSHGSIRSICSKMFPIRLYTVRSSFPQGCIWSPTHTLAPFAMARKYSYSRAFSCRRERADLLNSYLSVSFLDYRIVLKISQLVPINFKNMINFFLIFAIFSFIIPAGAPYGRGFPPFPEPPSPSCYR